jgi:ZIP family zinc transporter
MPPYPRGTYVLLAAIACAAFSSTLTGGLLALQLRDKLHLILGFSAGAVIGVALFDLLPESIEFAARTVGGPGAATLLTWTAVGFFAYLILDRSLLLHGRPVTTRGALGASILCLHSLIDGVAIGLAFQASRSVGLVVAIAVLTHDFSDGVNTMNIVIKHRGERRAALAWLIADALAPSLGIALSLAVVLPVSTLGYVLALFAGFFLFIGASDLIPESFHAHPKFLTTAMTVAGAAVLYLAVSLAAHAAAVAGVEVADRSTQGSTTLVLNGAGKREKFIFDVYVAALYLPRRETSAQAIVAATEPKRLTLTLLRDLSAEQLGNALHEGLSLNRTPAELNALTPQIDALIATMNALGSAKKGSVLTIDFLADGTTRVAQDEKTAGAPIAGVAFQRALLDVWLGPKPVQSDLKTALLGTGASP